MQELEFAREHPEIVDYLRITPAGQLYIPMYIDGSSGDAALEAHMAHIFREVHDIWKRKQHDYGPGNIAQAGERGVATRANDKCQRLMHLDGHAAANESVEDSWLDLCDYGAIGLALHRGWWPKVESEIGPRIIIEAGQVYVEDEEGRWEVDLKAIGRAWLDELERKLFSGSAE